MWLVALQVYAMTGLDKLAPSKGVKQRLYANINGRLGCCFRCAAMLTLPMWRLAPPRFKLTSVATQYKIAEAHNLIPLANTEGLLLTEREEGKMFDIARCCWRNWFTNTASRLVADSPGRLSAGMLMHDIWRNMDNTVWCSTPGRLWALS